MNFNVSEIKNNSRVSNNYAELTCLKEGDKDLSFFKRTVLRKIQVSFRVNIGVISWPVIEQ